MSRGKVPTQTDKPSADKGRDSVTDAMDAYWINGKDMVEGWHGQSTEPSSTFFIAAYMIGAAILHGAEILANVPDTSHAVKERR